VSPEGSDEGAGTHPAPLRTIGRAVALARPGDVIHVLPGVYPEELVLGSHGPDAAPIVLRGEGLSRPTLVPSDRTRSALIRVSGSWSLENLNIDVGGAPMFAVLFDSGARHAVLSHTELRGGSSSAGVRVAGARDITLQRNTLHHFIRPGREAHGVEVVGPSRDIILRDNDIHHNSGDSIHCQAGDGPAEAVLIEGNTLHDEGGSGVHLLQCRHVTVRDNRLHGVAGEAVLVQESARDIFIQGNTFSRVGPGVLVGGNGPPPENVWVEANHFQEMHGLPEGGGPCIRITRARNVRVVGNTLEGPASHGLVLATEGGTVTGLVVSDNVPRSGSRTQD
jgi:hypothetical protein